MITRIDWRASWISVFVVLVIGFVTGLLINMATSLWIQRSSSSASELATTLAVASYGVACVMGVVYGAAIGALYAWLAGRRKALDASDAVVGAAASVIVFIVISGGINACWSSTSTLMALQQAGAQLSPETAGSTLFGILLSTVLRSFLELVIGLVVAVAAALGVARLARPA